MRLGEPSLTSEPSAAPSPPDGRAWLAGVAGDEDDEEEDDEDERVEEEQGAGPSMGWNEIRRWWPDRKLGGLPTARLCTHIAIMQKHVTNTQNYVIITLSNVINYVNYVIITLSYVINYVMSRNAI